MSGGAGLGALAALAAVIVMSVWLGAVAQRAVQRGTFVKGYFLGNRALGSWAMALTATVQSGGTFMGYPSLVYTHGWVVALWISSYMIVPLASFGVLGKRLAQLSRRTGAITVPDLFRARFDSPAAGLTASLLIMFFLAFMMVAQFKAGASIMKIAWPGSGALALGDDLPLYQLDPQALNNLSSASVLDAETRRALEPLVGRGFASRAEFDAALKLVLASAQRGEDSELRSAIIRGAEQTDWLFYLGLAIFTVTVVGYSLVGGFLAAVWTDLFQSVLMFAGVVVLFVLVVPVVGGLEVASRKAVVATGPAFLSGPGYAPDGRQFLPLGMAVSYFFFWVFAGIGSPAGMVRVMATNSTATLRRSIVLLAGYNWFIYLPLIGICVAARAVMPALEQSDEVIPRMSLWATRELTGGSFITGLILAAPFGAVMATVSSYLVVIASGLVRDVYQKFVNPSASDMVIRRLSYLTMIVMGTIAVVANLRPIQYLQALVLFSGGGQAATFVVPILMLAYWRRATTAGVLAAMLGGAGTVLGLFVAGWLGYGPSLVGQATRFRPYYLLNCDPIIWGLAVSLVAGIGVSLLTKPPRAELIRPLFAGSGSEP
ncbi:MAG: sodium:solute symporter [Pirellulales bacterium]|nr:sodium:solute symporter [Pirellulales bacterium]